MKQGVTNMQNILIVVDMQNDFIDGALGTKEAAAIVPKVEEKIRNFDGKVFFTRDTHETYYLETQEGKNLPVPHPKIKFLPQTRIQILQKFPVKKIPNLPNLQKKQLPSPLMTGRVHLPEGFWTVWKQTMQKQHSL